MPKEITKEGLKYLNKVIEYRNRTIAVRFILNTDELENTWEEAQFELGSKYQYQGENERIWDYYLALCCNFDEASLSNEVRFRIESDRFCCRKIFIFNQSESKFSIDLLISGLFPKIESSGKISLLKPDDFIPSLKVSPQITKDFFTRPWNDKEIAKLAQILIIEAAADDENTKN